MVRVLVARVHNKQEYATPDLFTMGHWHGEISSNVTFAYFTKGCIDVGVLRGGPLTYVVAKPKFICRTFPFFFSSRKLAERLHKG